MEEAKLCSTPQLSPPGRTAIRQASTAGCARHSQRPAKLSGPAPAGGSALLCPGERQRRQLQEQQAKAGMEAGMSLALRLPSAGQRAQGSLPPPDGPWHGWHQGAEPGFGQSNSLLKLQREQEGSASSRAAPVPEERLCAVTGPVQPPQAGRRPGTKAEPLLGCRNRIQCWADHPNRAAAQPQGHSPALPGAARAPRNRGAAPQHSRASSEKNQQAELEPASAAGRGCRGGRGPVLGSPPGSTLASLQEPRGGCTAQQRMVQQVPGNRIHQIR